MKELIIYIKQNFITPYGDNLPQYTAEVVTYELKELLDKEI